MTSTKLQKNNEDSGYYKGIMGAILGALIIIVPWMLLKSFFDFNAALLAYFLGLAIYKGYTWNKGESGPMTRWIILITSIISLIVAQCGLMLIELLRDDLEISMGNIKDLFHSFGGVNTLTFNMIFAVILLFLFIKPLFKELKYDTKNKDFKM